MNQKFKILEPSSGISFVFEVRPCYVTFFTKKSYFLSLIGNLRLKKQNMAAWLKISRATIPTLKKTAKKMVLVSERNQGTVHVYHCARIRKKPRYSTCISLCKNASSITAYFIFLFVCLFTVDTFQIINNIGTY